MEDQDVRRELGEHLVEEVLQGRMTRRQLMVRASVFGLSATAIGSLLAACGSSSPSTSASASAAAPKTGGTMRVTMVPPVGSPNPVTMYDAGSIAVVQQVCEYLVWVENDLSLRPVLAQSWSPDSTGKVWTFKLRQGVTFNDGSPFGADDVVFTFKLLTDPKTGSAALSNFEGVLVPSGVVKVDDATVAFHLERPFADFPYLVSSSNYNAVVLPQTFNNDFVKNPVGTGPFMITSYKGTEQATPEAQPHLLAEGPAVPERCHHALHQRHRGAEPAAAGRRRRHDAFDTLPGVEVALREPQDRRPFHTVHADA